MYMPNNTTSKYMQQQSTGLGGDYSTPFSVIDRND